MKEITLTKQELEDIKDTIKFREKVLLQLKQLNGIPKQVWSLRVKVNLLYAVVTGVVITWIVKEVMR